MYFIPVLYFNTKCMHKNHACIVVNISEKSGGNIDKLTLPRDHETNPNPSSILGCGGHLLWWLFIVKQNFSYSKRKRILKKTYLGPKQYRIHYLERFCQGGGDHC